MPQRTYEQTSKVAVSVSKVYAHFATPQNFIGFQPFVRAVRDERWTESSDGARTVHYQLVESVPLFLGLRVTAVSQVETCLPPQGNVLVQQVNAGFGVSLQSVVTITADGDDAAQIHEQIAVGAPALLMGYVSRRAHDALIARHEALRGGYLTSQ